MQTYLFFDSASTTRCCEAAVHRMKEFGMSQYGNPSFAHAMGQRPAQAIQEARSFFGNHFGVNPSRVVFTGSGSESDNLAIYGVAMAAMARRLNKPGGTPPPRVITSAIEHSAVSKTMESLATLGFDVQVIPVDAEAQVVEEKLMEALTPETVIVSIMQINNIVGSILPIEKLAEKVKRRVPEAVFHTDAVQAFGKIPVPTAPSSVDLVSISAHKLEGPKGVGALVILNENLTKEGRLRPLIWGGGQEGGFRSGTQNAGLIAGFQAAAELALENQEEHLAHYRNLNQELRSWLEKKGLLHGTIKWLSPKDAFPGIVALGFEKIPTGPLASLLEERRCLVATGSACSSKSKKPDPVLVAMGHGEIAQSGIRISFAGETKSRHIKTLANAIEDSVAQIRELMV